MSAPVGPDDNPASAPRHADPRVARLVAFFEAMQPADLDRLAEIYRDDARFKDPFNQVQGLAGVRHIYAHMFDTLEGPRFVVREVVAEGGRCWLTWDFLFRRRGSPTDWRIHGASLLRLDQAGRIADHRDYWDAAEELYEKLPVLGALMRALRRRLAS